MNNGGASLAGWNGGTGGDSTSSLPSPAVGNYCAFACHWASGSSATNQIDYDGAGRGAGETMQALAPPRSPVTLPTPISVPP